MPIKLVRPSILTRAGKAGARLYDRGRDLPRVIPRLTTRRMPQSAMLQEIADAEATCEAERLSGAATYSIERHVSLLAALFAEGGAARPT